MPEHKLPPDPTHPAHEPSRAGTMASVATEALREQIVMGEIAARPEGDA
jgi:hypothetical protein